MGWQCAGLHIGCTIIGCIWNGREGVIRREWAKKRPTQGRKAQQLLKPPQQAGGARGIGGVGGVGGVYKEWAQEGRQ